jgi:hypothetical protein
LLTFSKGNVWNLMIAVAECTIEVLSRTIMCPALNTTHLTVKVTGFEVVLIVPPTPFPPPGVPGLVTVTDTVAGLAMSSARMLHGKLIAT